MSPKIAAPAQAVTFSLVLLLSSSAQAGVGDFFGRLFGSSKSAARGQTVKETLPEALPAAQGAKRSVHEILTHTDPLEKLSQGLFRDLAARIESSHYVPTLGRGQYIDQAMMNFNNPVVGLVSVEGSEGIGRTQIGIGLQERIKSNQVPATLVGAKVIQFNSSHIFSTDLKQVESQLQVLKDNYAKDFKGLYIFDFTEIETFLTDGAKSNRSFDRIIEEITRQLGRDRVKFMIEGTTAQASTLARLTSIGRNLGRVKLKALSSFYVLEVAKDVAARIKSEKDINISDEVLEDAVRLSEIHLGHVGAPKSVVSLLLGAQSQREILMHSSESPLSAELRDLVKNLKLDLAKANRLKGAFATLRRKEIPTEIKGLELQIAKLDQRFNALKEALEKRKILAARATELNARSGLRKEKEELASQLKELNAVIKQVTPDELAWWLHLETGKPVDEILQKELSVEEIKKVFNRELFGQPESVAAAIRAAQRAKDNYRTSNAPVSTILLIGPPGNGKTETAKVLSQIRGDLVRIDGAELADSHQVARLIGAPPGYLGHDPQEPGYLLKAVKEKPNAVILLDEIQKMHRKANDVFYPVFTDGIATGSNNETVSFKNTIVVGTMNPSEQAVFPPNATRQEIIQVLLSNPENQISPALFDRFDEIILTKSLDHTVYAKIMNKEIGRFNESLAKDLKQVRLTPEAEKAILEPLFSAEETARNLNRMVKEKVTDPIRSIFRGDGLQRETTGASNELELLGGDLIEIGFKEGQFTFRVVPPSEI